MGGSSMDATTTDAETSGVYSTVRILGTLSIFSGTFTALP